jgi:hypothetical protein
MVKTVKVPYGTIDLIPGVINKNAKVAFTTGQCHALAIMSARRLKCPIRLLVSQESLNYATPGAEIFPLRDLRPDRSFVRWYHAAVQVGPNKFLDILGVASAYKMASRFSSTPENLLFIETTEAELRSAPSDGGGVRPALAVSRSFVDPVIDKYLS